MNLTITILDIIHHPVFYLNTHYFGDRTRRWITSRTVIVILIHCRHKTVLDISYASHSLFHNWREI
jgi:hypothetical protein